MAGKPASNVNSKNASVPTANEGIHSISNSNMIGKALILLNEKGVDEAIAYLSQLGVTQDRTPMALSHRLSTLATLIQQKDPKSSLFLSLKAIELNNENITAWLLAGTIQDKLGDRKASAESMRRVVRSPLSKPDQVLRAANLLVRFGEHQEALNSAKVAFDQLGKPIHLATSLMYIAKLTADWALVDELKLQMLQAYEKGLWAEVGETPRTHLLWCGDESININVIKNWSERTIRIPEKVVKPIPETLQGRRIRLGYLSSDFRDHPTSRLINGLLKHHDRSKFELFMYDSGWDDKSAMRKEIESQFEHRHAVAHLSDEVAAQLIRSHRIDVLIELNGPTRAHRMGILAYRPAPVQIDYLGWPGSVGGRIVDYIIGDEYTVPHEAETLYPEKVIKLSKTYQVNDFAYRTLPSKPSRKQVGLPEGDHLILGMFNAINKVDAAVWGTWMKIMQAVPNSLLWLLDPGAVACRFIAKETRKRGIDVKRIVIAPRLKQEAHLARMQCCDLMLDPWPYGGHTSTSDALFAGVPVIALKGTNFASRVSGSLLNAAGMGVMVQPDKENYVNKAIQLLKNPQLLKQAKKFLSEKTPTSNLFNSGIKTKNLENAFISILCKDLNNLSNIHKAPKIRRTETHVIWFNITLSQNWKKQPVGIARAEIEIIKNLIHRMTDVPHGFIEFKNDQFISCIPNKFQIDDEPIKFDKFLNGDTLVDLGLDINCNHSESYHKLRDDNVRIIMICYDLIPIIYPQYTSEHTKSFFPTYLKNMTNVATDIIFISNKTKDDYIEYSKTTKNSTHSSIVITLGSSLSASKQTPSSAINKILTENYILYVSTIERRKNHETLYRAYHLLCRQGKKDSIPNLIFVGVLGWGISELLNDLALDPVTKGKIFIFNNLSDVQLKNLYSNCMFTVYPSLYEGWGLPVAESLALGKFVLCSDRGALPEVGRTFVEYLDPWNVSEWAHNIEKYSNDIQLLNEKESAIKRYFVANSWDDTAKQVLDFLLYKK